MNASFAPEKTELSRLERAQEAFVKADWPAAAEALKEALEEAPHNAELSILLGHARMNGKDVSGALEAYDACVRLAPEQSVVHACRAMALQVLHRAAEASASADRALAIDPNDVIALKVKTRLAINASDVDAAMTLCKQLMAIVPDDQDVMLLANECLALPQKRTVVQNQSPATTHTAQVAGGPMPSRVDWSRATKQELQAHLRSLLAQVGFRRLQQAGFHVQGNDYYSPLNDVDFLEANPDLWVNPPLTPPAINWRLDEQLAAARELAPFVSELADVPAEPAGDCSRFAWKNNFWENADALVQYGLVRARKPKRYVEIGCGWSSLLLKRALERNRAEGHDCAVTLIEPYPNPAIFRHLPSTWTIHRKMIQRADPAIYDQLEAGDVLFYDGSHCAKVGSDVNWFFFHVLPRLKPGVLIHIHDISLPHEYPKPWIFDRGQTWNEQYVLQAFLMHNDAYRITLANRFIFLHRQTELERLYGKIQPVYGSSFWMEKVSS